jgi:lipoate-protein ligase A
MNERVRMIVEEARKLSPEERREMFDWLDVEFAGERSDGTPEEIEAAWMEEVERRAAKAERGETTPIDFDEAIAKARQRIR